MNKKYKLYVWFYQSTQPKIIDDLCQIEMILIKNKLDKNKLVAKVDMTIN